MVAALCLILTGCISSNPSGLALSQQNTQQPVPTPQVAVLGTGQPQGSELPDQNDGVVVGQPAAQTTDDLQLASAPQPSPIKATTAPIDTAAAATVATTQDAPLAIVSASQSTDPAVTQVASLVKNDQPAPAPVIAAAVPDTTVPTVTTPPAITEAPTPDAIVEDAPPAQPAVVKKPEVKKTGLLARLFGNDNKPKAKTKPTPIRERFASTSSRNRNEGASSRNNNLNERFASKKPKAKSKIKTVRRKTRVANRLGGGADRSALPGVKSNNELFGINLGRKRPKAGATDNNTQLASLGNLGRLSPKGLRLQHDKVQVACLKPGVLKVLKLVERKYGSKPIITSGYRSPKRNRRAGGARRSQHVFCKAVDIQVEGVSKWQLAKYLRSIPGRGGVGTYCRTKSVHIDIGSKRDWHHPCRRSAKRKRKKA